MCVGNFYTHEVGFTSMSDLTHINSKFSMLKNLRNFHSYICLNNLEKFLLIFPNNSSLTLPNNEKQILKISISHYSSASLLLKISEFFFHY